MEQTINKKELVKLVAEATERTQVDAKEVVDATFEAIANALAEGDQVSITNFGKFSTSVRAAREAVNPQDPTGAKIQVPETTVPKFKASSVLKNAVK